MQYHNYNIIIFISDVEKRHALPLASVSGSGFLICLHSLRQAILAELTNWMEIDNPEIKHFFTLYT